MADPKNGRGVKIASGISLTVVATAFGLFYMISDRAGESGEAKATLKMEVEKVVERVDHLEEHSEKTDNLLNGPEGIVTSVAVIKNDITAIKAQGVQILLKLNEISKNKP